MFRVLCLLVLAVLHGVNGEDCVPEPIQALQLDVNSTLHWQASSNCDDVSYLVYLMWEGSLQHIYQVHPTFLDVSFLPACELYRFIVYAVADTFLSESRFIDTKLPAEPGTNLTVTHFVAKQQGEDAVLLEWELDEKWAHCVQYFRVVHWDGETTPVDTYTTFDYILIDGLAPCSTFEFTVTPIYNDELEGGIGLLEYETPPHNAHFPTIQSITSGVTFADMVWRLPPYTTNRCPIETFILDASPHINLTIPIHDVPGRPPISVRAHPLRPESMYLFRVTMVNSGGASTPVQVAIQTLPDDTN